MNDTTLELIYALKRRNYEKDTLLDEAIAFLAAYTCTPIGYYNEAEMGRIAQMAFVDYLKTARNPAYEVQRFFDIFNRNSNTTATILECLRSTQVRDENGYINGFREGKWRDG